MENLAIKSNTSDIGDVIVCTHEINTDVISKLNSFDNNTLLTFDDGLYSQYLFRNNINNKNRIYFICPSLLCTSQPSDLFITCFDAMSNHFFNNDNSAYMTIDNVKQLIDEGYTIGAHSYYHANLKYKSKKIHKYKLSYSLLCNNNLQYAENDTELLVNWFINNIGYVPIDYCFPFNQATEELKQLLISYGFKHFYGRERHEVTS